MSPTSNNFARINALEAALLEYVERYGLTPKAREVLGKRDFDRPAAPDQ